MLYIIPLITNPIFISSGIVFVRIYWFEKRLDSLVQDARLGRWKTTTKARPEGEEADLNRAERGVGEFALLSFSSINADMHTKLGDLLR